MSTFPGKLQEYPFISIDRFDNDNLSSVLFFLSHCHMDHMVGLDSKEFIRRLQTRNVKLYCSAVTKLLLEAEQRFKDVAALAVPLKENVTHCLEVPDEADVCLDVKSVKVTLMDAHHCLGSVMFLFESSSDNDCNRVLYTGDFRLTPGDFSNMSCLRTSVEFGAAVKPIERVYLDTTFCDRRSKTFPSPEESFRVIKHHIREWLSLSNEHKVLLYTASKYGHEFLFERLSKICKEKIHVSGWKAAVYEKVPSLQPYTTNDGYSTRIHACAYWDAEDECGSVLPQKDGDSGDEGEDQDEPEKSRSGRGKKTIMNNSYCPCLSTNDPRLLIIKPSAMFFYQTGAVRAGEWCKKMSPNYVRVFYSMHSCLDEIRAFVRYLSPKNLYANVVPMGSKNSWAIGLLRDLVPVTIDEPESENGVAAQSVDEEEHCLTNENEVPFTCHSLSPESPEIGSKPSSRQSLAFFIRPLPDKEGASADHLRLNQVKESEITESPLLFSDDDLPQAQEPSLPVGFQCFNRSQSRQESAEDLFHSSPVFDVSSSGSSTVVSSCSRSHLNAVAAMDELQTSSPLLPSGAFKLSVDSQDIDRGEMPTVVFCDDNQTQPLNSSDTCVVNVENVAGNSRARSVIENWLSSSPSADGAVVGDNDEITMLNSQPRQQCIRMPSTATNFDLKEDSSGSGCCLKADKESDIIDITSSLEAVVEVDSENSDAESMGLSLWPTPPKKLAKKETNQNKKRGSSAKSGKSTEDTLAEEVGESEEQRRKRKSAGIKTPQKQFSDGQWLNRVMLLTKSAENNKPRTSCARKLHNMSGGTSRSRIKGTKAGSTSSRAKNDLSDELEVIEEKLAACQKPILASPLSRRKFVN